MKVKLLAVTANNEIFEAVDVDENAVVLKIKGAKRIVKRELVRKFFTTRDK